MTNMEKVLADVGVYLIVATVAFVFGLLSQR